MGSDKLFGNGFRVYKMHYCHLDSKTHVQICLSSFTIKMGFFMVYVDDSVLIGDDSTFITSVIQFLQSHFALKTLGKLHYFLGIEAQ